MKTTHLAELKDLEDGEPIMRVEGRLVKVWDHRSGSNDKGDWSFQNADMEDASGSTKVKFVNKPDMQPFTKKLISITAYKGEKGFSGLYAADDSYESKKTGKTVTNRVLKVTATGKVDSMDGTAVKESPKPEKETHVELDETDVTKTIRRKLMQVVNGFMLVERAVKAQVDAAKDEGIECDLSNFGGKCSSAYRELNGLISKLPDDHPIWAKKEATKEELQREIDDW